jgi:alpha-amylase/alpha-mannosidase (GH57 family)
VERYVCIHGHFYQPPRENPWLGSIEFQEGAAPYHDWNERITAECYAPNARSRILTPDGVIERIANNYSRMSFNFGATLLSWLEEKAPEVYAAVVEADRESIERFSGHGSAIAQPYNHTILPLTAARDRRTQVLWGIRDFEHRFGRRPEGMWLPETAVDVDSLEALAEAGIQFTILAPHQARRVRGAGGSWHDVSHGDVDTRRPYRVRLPSGRAIAVFFYDGPTARAVAFERLLTQGEDFVHRLLAIFSHGQGPELATISTDGETYGHHHRFGDMALAYAIDRFEAGQGARLTNYGEFLERHPPQWEAEITPNTSWSCGHGVERWRDDCGCSTGVHPDWNQSWRRPLREALDWLHDALDVVYEKAAAELLLDPWEARDDYVGVILDRSPAAIEAFLAKHARARLDHSRKVRSLKLLELQTHAMLMYTSCGWFFDDISGIEARQVLQYAGRAIQLSEEVDGSGIEKRFVALLAKARSNLPEYGDGSAIYRKYVHEARVDLAHVVAHYAVSSLFEQYGESTRVHSYAVQREDFKLDEAGRTKLGFGLVQVASRVTLESDRMSFGVLHFGDHNITGGVKSHASRPAYEKMATQLKEAFDRADLSELLQLLDDAFPGRPFSLRSLFRDEQRAVLRRILNPSLENAELLYRSIYQENLPLIRFLRAAEQRVPDRLRIAAEFALNLELRRILSQDEVNVPRVPLLLEEARLAGVDLDRRGLSQALKTTIDRLAESCQAAPEDVLALHRLHDAVRLARHMPFDVDFWRAQNAFYDLLQETYPEMKRRAGQGETSASRWTELFYPLGDDLRVRIPLDG